MRAMSQSMPNIVWLTLESVRADHTALGDYGRETTPNLDRIASDPDGVGFPNCFAHARWTPASSASMLTGTHLTTHGVGLDSDDVHRVPENLATVPELLGREGYRTGCVSSNSYLTSATGLDRGFDRFLWPDRYDALRNPGTVLRFLLNYERHWNLPMGAKRLNLTYDIVTDTAKRWLDEFRSARDPFFLYVHYNTSHHPYRPPHSYLAELLADTDLTPAEAIETARNVTENMWEVMAEGCRLTETERTALQASYDASIAYVDDMVGDLFDHVRDGGFEDTVVVVTGDHGELFGEQGVLGHNLVLDDGVLNVPMIVHGFDDLDAEPDTLVQHIDVMETLVAAAGGDTSQFQGVDLRGERREFTLSQRGPRGSDIDRLRELNPDFDDGRFHRSLLHALRTPEYKYVESEERAELHRLPDETVDVSAEHPEVRDRLATALAERREEVEREAAGREAAEFTDAMRDQLRDMGYL